MILGIGIDICPVERIEGIVERQGETFEKRVFTETERNYAQGAVKGERLSARWAAKEAAIKALGAPAGLKWYDLEVVNAPNGAPSLKMAGQAKHTADKMGVKNVLLTISHAGGMAVAVVILEG